MKPLVIYHANCLDGFGAAFAAWLRLGSNAEYLPMHYGEWEEKLSSGVGQRLFDSREVFILDFSFPKDQMLQIMERADEVVWLDHHKTAFESWCGEPREYYEDRIGPHYIRLDNNRSGAMLAWVYFHAGDIPDFIRYIDDRDRWQFKYENTQPFHAGMQLMKPWSFEAWIPLTVPSYLQSIVYKGIIVKQYQDTQVKSLAEKAINITIPLGFATLAQLPEGGDKGLCVGSPVETSELGHALACRSGTFGLVWFLKGTDTAVCSLRSNGDFDTTVISRAFGGGGHKNASGFKVPITTLLGWMK